MKKKVVAIIPARGGSKGIPRKNIRLLSEKPLIAYVIETALNSSIIDRVVVSTENEVIAQIAELYGAEVIHRPSELARDDITLDGVIYHAIASLEEREERICGKTPCHK